MSTISDDIGDSIRNKMKYIENNPLFQDYRYPPRNNEIVKKVLISRKNTNYEGWGDYDSDDSGSFVNELRNYETENSII